ncbi:hypothetical protein R3W88_000844 [Solanum pinnatisectum]|uniref:Uncharacterized protein n=1 Tax=Solanum pinnatisectum TaxID=50273 RepID=A0AAV9MIL1_9SOLN|nr:hypothetical protein R3W88_000844 [Solanum pinnatisectum]
MTREENLIKELGTDTKPELRKTSTLRQTRMLHERKTSLILKDPTAASTKRREQIESPLPVPGDIQIAVQAQAPKWHRNRVHKGRTHTETKLRNY